MPGTPRGILEKRLQLAHWRALIHILRELADTGGDRLRHDVREHRAAVSDGQLYRGPRPDDSERLVRSRRRRSRNSVAWGKSVSVRVDLGGARRIKYKTMITNK